MKYDAVAINKITEILIELNPVLEDPEQAEKAATDVCKIAVQSLGLMQR